MNLQHHNLVSLLGLCTVGSEPIWLVTELCANGSLLEFLTTPRDDPLVWLQVILCCYGYAVVVMVTGGYTCCGACYCLPVYDY